MTYNKCFTLQSRTVGKNENLILRIYSCLINMQQDYTEHKNTEFDKIENRLNEIYVSFLNQYML